MKCIETTCVKNGYSGGSRGRARAAPPPPHPLFWVKLKKSQRDEELAGDTKQTRAHLAQGLDPPLGYVQVLVI